VAISGNTVVVGASCAKIGSNRSQGAAYIFLKPATGWNTTSTFAAKLTASDGAAGDSLGQAVAISGNTVVVAAPFKNVNGVPQGEVYVFVEPSGGWTSMTETARLNPSDATTSCSAPAYCTFGGSVAISSNTVVAGSAGNIVGSNTSQGALYDFVMPAGGWTNMTQTAKLTNSAGLAADELGLSVAISGNTVVGGAPGVTNGPWPVAGAAYVFLKPVGGWTNSSTPNAQLSAKDASQYDYFGYLVAVSGATVVVGTPQFGNPQIGPQAPGKAYIFIAPTYSQAAELTSSDGSAGDAFGQSVAISGNTVLAGANLHPYNGGNFGPGEAYLFLKPATGWKNTTQSAKLDASNGMTGDYFGNSVSVSGHTALVGAWGHTDSGPYQYQGQRTSSCRSSVLRRVMPRSDSVGASPPLLSISVHSYRLCGRGSDLLSVAALASCRLSRGPALNLLKGQHALAAEFPNTEDSRRTAALQNAIPLSETTPPAAVM
jgi:hypothetical protein